MKLEEADIVRKLLHHRFRDEKGLLFVRPSDETYFGAEMDVSGISLFSQAQSQHFSMELYESRVASLQRFVALCVIFHEMGRKVQSFFHNYSFGLLGYKMNRTHSFLRIATTASPVSGDSISDQMEKLRIRASFQNAVHHISVWHWQRQQRLVRDLKKEHFSPSPVVTKKAVSSLFGSELAELPLYDAEDDEADGQVHVS